jgi:hypothetical protein
MLDSHASPVELESAVALAPLFGTSGKANREFHLRQPAIGNQQSPNNRQAKRINRCPARRAGLAAPN